MSKNLADKVALGTGGSAGIGLASARIARAAGPMNLTAASSSS